MNSIFAIVYAFGLSYMPINQVGLNKRIESFHNSTKVEFMLGLEVLDMFTLYGGEQTTQQMDNSLFNWLPINQMYFVGLQFHKQFNNTIFTVDIKRTCSHPVKSWDKPSSSYNTASFEINLSVKGKFNL